MFEIVTKRQVIFGENQMEEIPQLVKWYGCKKVFLVSAPAVRAAYERIAALLKNAGIAHVYYDKIVSEPDLNMINTGRDLFVEQGCDCTIALGGGSVLDAAKAIGMLANNGGMIEQYQMEGRQVTKVPPLFIAIPLPRAPGRRRPR